MNCDVIVDDMLGGILWPYVEPPSPNVIHPNWLRDRELQPNKARCPVCGNTRTARTTRWWYDEGRGTWRCKSSICGAAFDAMEVML